MEAVAVVVVLLMLMLTGEQWRKARALRRVLRRRIQKHLS